MHITVQNFIWCSLYSRIFFIFYCTCTSLCCRCCYLHTSSCGTFSLYCRTCSLWRCTYSPSWYTYSLLLFRAVQYDTVADKCLIRRSWEGIEKSKSQPTYVWRLLISHTSRTSLTLEYLKKIMFFCIISIILIIIFVYVTHNISQFRGNFHFLFHKNYIEKK